MFVKDALEKDGIILIPTIESRTDTHADLEVNLFPKINTKNYNMTEFFGRRVTKAGDYIFTVAICSLTPPYPKCPIAMGEFVKPDTVALHWPGGIITAECNHCVAGRTVLAQRDFSDEANT